MYKSIRVSIIIALGLIAMIVFPACSSNGASKISSSTVKKLVTENMKEEADADTFRSLKVGYFEENDNDARFTLRKLAAAGVITYKVDRIETSRRVKNGYTIDYRTYRVVDTYKTIKDRVYFVDVALTEEGQQYVVTELPKRTPKEDKFLKPVEYVHYPEFDVPEEEVFPEDQIEEPTVEPKAEEKNEEEEKKEEPKTDYERAKAKEHFNSVFVKCYSVKVVDVRDILVKDGAAQADFVLEAFDVSPFGRVYNKVFEHSHTLGDAKFIYYQDKGWVVDAVDSSDLFI
jgi:hypothetical protein